MIKEKYNSFQCSFNNHGKLERYFNSGEVDFQRCCNCDQVFRQPFPTDDQLETIYSDLYNESNIKVGNTDQESNKYTVDAYADFLIEHLLEPTQKVLDFGAGSGALVETLRRRGFECDGIESSPEAREYCKNNRGIALYSCIDDVAEASYDFVIMIEVIEHLSDPWKDLAKIKMKLLPAGQLFVTTPNREGVRARIEKGNWREATKKFHLILFNRYSLIRLLTNSIGSTKSIRFSPIQKSGWKHWEWNRLCQLIGLPGTLCVVASLDK